MVEDSRKASGAGPIRPLNLPAPLDVEEDERGRPAAIVVKGLGSGVWGVGSRQKIASIQDRWEIADEWWRAEPVARAYYRVVMEDGRGVTIFHDLINGGWYRQSA